MTQTWQGYVGNVSGVIELADASDRALYNWSVAQPKGEVYASTSEILVWANIQCFNFTAAGVYGDESGDGGTTNLNGTNLALLEAQFGLDSSDVDGVDETFSLTGPGTHGSFYTAGQEFSEGECRSTRIFGDSGKGEPGEFEEVLLYEPTTASVVFVSLIDNDLGGYDSGLHDFEMLVLEDGHGADIITTPYYFFVELA
ncbi:MAG: hypothetical protein KKD18_06070 [Nanoarchaeota archaeon]|nr:hypothetical protein [Nanoarchaeota archaeon]MBU0977958.1 hypothetical protein [Nanoarchaeota archaeon]